MSSLRPFLLVAIALTAVSSVWAGAYVKVSGLYNQPSDLRINNASAFKASLKNNMGLGAAVGYKFSLLRAEAEIQHLRNGTNPNQSSGTLLGGTSETIGTLKETSGFANAYLDLPSFFGLAPYLGAGLGYARVDLDNLGLLRNSRPVLQFGGRDNVFGYQGMLGIQFHLLGRATVHAGYRIVKREDLSIRDVVANAQQTLTLGNNRIFEIGVALGF